MEDKLTIFISRLKKLNIDIKIISNYPWIYIYEINGKKVTEKYQSDYGFTISVLSINNKNQINFTNISEIFKLIRKYS